MEFQRLSFFFILFLLISSTSADPQLTPNFYDRSCPLLEKMVGRLLSEITSSAPLDAIALLRLHFHDCFVNGCDASILLDDHGSFVGEKTAGPNKNTTARGFTVVDAIKDALETICPGTVSCADILALASRDVVVLMGGPSWTVSLGRRDSVTASLEAANKDLPSPTSTLNDILAKFGSKRFTPREMVVLSGAHTIGRAHCASFKNRVTGNGDPELSTARLESLRQSCKANTEVYLDTTTPTQFDTSYYTNLKANNGLLSSDQLLYKSYPKLVDEYSANKTRFFEEFAAAMAKLGNLSPLTGKEGEVRRHCRYINSQ